MAKTRPIDNKLSVTVSRIAKARNGKLPNVSRLSRQQGEVKAGTYRERCPTPAVGCSVWLGLWKPTNAVPLIGIDMLSRFAGWQGRNPHRRAGTLVRQKGRDTRWKS